MRKAIALVLLTLLPGCPNQEKPALRTDPGEPSPNASIMPAPLASGSELEQRPRRANDEAGLANLPLESAGRLTFAEAGVEPPPRAFREDEAPPRDTLAARDATGVTLDAQWKWFDLPNPVPAPDLDADSIKNARQKAALMVTVDLASAGRMRFTFASATFPLALHTELRARHDRYGHVLVWPDGNAYRVIPKGALRALFAERRADLTGLLDPKPRRKEAGSMLGLPTTRIELSTPLGQLLLEQASIAGAGESGELLCRLLVELSGVMPSSLACAPDLTPLRAEYRAAERRRISFEVSSITRKQDMPLGFIYVPPVGAMFKPGELPPEASPVFLTRHELAKFRTRDLAAARPSDKAPGEGLTAVNRTDTLRYVLIDGVPVAWVRPHSEQYVIGPRPGRYLVSWRDFLGSEPETRKQVQLPARVVLGREDDGGAAGP